MRIFEIATPKDTKVLKTEKGSVVKRYPKLGVGKPMGGAVYIHKYYENLLPDAFDHYKEILSTQFPDYEYNIVKFGKDGASFLYSPDFDTAEEPVVESYVTVKSDGSAKPGKSKTIYHHKWLFVKDDYPGFDVDKSFERSKAWLQIPSIPFSKIGQNKEYWNSFLQQNKDRLPSDFNFDNTSKFNEAIYTGDSIEKGDTSRFFKGTPAPGVVQLVEAGIIKPGMTVLDYGAGKQGGRNTLYLRSLGVKVFAYDKYNGEGGANGWTSVAEKEPSEHFDLGFSSYVLNVVKKEDEDHIVNFMESHCKKVIHIVRNNDLVIQVTNALKKKSNPYIMSFFKNHFLKDHPEIKVDLDLPIPNDIIAAFCDYGVQTNKKEFQRLPDLTGYGYRTIFKSGKSAPYLVYTK